MDQVRLLFFIPPPKPFDFASRCFKPFFGFLDLGLMPSMCKLERSAMVNQDFHATRKYC